MPVKRVWFGPDLQLHCPNCHEVWVITLHPGFRVCPHDDNKAMGDCERCTREAMATGEMIPSATPPPLPTPPPPPSPAFGGMGGNGNFAVGNRFQDSLTPEERKIIEESMKQAEAHVPTRFEPE